MAKIFGTDGVRGVANGELTPELAFDLGRVGAHVLASHQAQDKPVKILIGQDTRLSGDLLVNALVAGVLSVGAHAYTVGVVPTPAVAWLVRQQEMTAGVMVSASHNPAADNGIKFFAYDGCKLADELEAEIESGLKQTVKLPRAQGEQIGRLKRVPEWVDLYLDYLISLSVPTRDMHLVVDCAHGAASHIAPALFTALGVQTDVINATPDGLNINAACGSTHPGGLAVRVRELGADLGIALDGDADRLIAVDHLGKVVDGDAIMAICALAMQGAGRLANNTLVATVMSNYGLEQAMQAVNIRLLRAQVGDRYVLEMMKDTGANLGGEQSGHIIFLDHSTTGDGLLSALKLLEAIAVSGRSLADLASVVTPWPQLLENVPVRSKDLLSAPQVVAATQEAEKLLQGRGRLLVRPSGTEPLVRVMAEATDEVLAGQAVQIVVQALLKA